MNSYSNKLCNCLYKSLIKRHGTIIVLIARATTLTMIWQAFPLVTLQKHHEVKQLNTAFMPLLLYRLGTVGQMRRST